jgi:hypothetical protein
LSFRTLYISSKHCCISKKYCSTPLASLLFIDRSLPTVSFPVLLYRLIDLMSFCIDPMNLLLNSGRLSKIS